MKKVMATLVSTLMLSVLAIAIVLILFPQQWKQSIYPRISEVISESVKQILPESYVNNSMCDSLETNLQIFANYLKTNQDIVDVKGMNRLDEQLERIQSRIDTIPIDGRNKICQQEYTRLEGLKSIFSLENTNHTLM